MQNVEVKIDDKVSTLNAIKFPYGTTTTLEIASPNIEYIQLKYKDGTNADGSDKYKLSEQFYDTQETGNAKITVTADENEEVGGYVVGWFSSKEYTGFVYSKKDYSNVTIAWEDIYTGTNITSQPENCYSIIKYFGNDEKNMTIKNKVKIRQRDFEIVEAVNAVQPWVFVWDNMFPITIVEDNIVCDNLEQLNTWLYAKSDWDINTTKYTFRGKLYVETILHFTDSTVTQINMSSLSWAPSYCSWETLTIEGNIEMLSGELMQELLASIFGFNSREGDFTNTTLKTINIVEGIKSIPYGTFQCKSLENISLPKTLESIGEDAFYDCAALKSITIPQNVKSIGSDAFRHCSNLTTTVGDIGGNWVKASDNTAVDANTLLKDIDYDIKKV